MTNTTLAVWFVPLAPGENPPIVPPVVQPLAQWQVPPDEPPIALDGYVTTLQNTSVDIDLTTLVSDAVTPASNLLFTAGSATNGSVVLLSDGHTACFTPATNFYGTGQFLYTVTDAATNTSTAAVVVTVLTVSSNNMQTTWIGGGADNDWSTAANWGGIAPTNGAALTFGTTARQINTNNWLSLVGGLIFTNAGWNLWGNPVTLTNSITHNVAGTNTWAINTTITNTVIVYGSNVSDILVLSGVISGAGTIGKAAGSSGQSVLRLTCPTNTYTGQAGGGSGTFEVTALANGGQPSSLGAGTGNIVVGTTWSTYAAALSYIGANNASTARGVTLNSGGADQPEQQQPQQQQPDVCQHEFLDAGQRVLVYTTARWFWGAVPRARARFEATWARWPTARCR